MTKSTNITERQEKQRAYNKKYREIHRDLIVERARLWREQNKERISGYVRSSGPEAKEKAKQRAKQSAEKNPQKVIEKHKRYRESNSHKIAFHCALRRSRKLQAIPAWADIGLIKAIYSRAAELRMLGEDVHVDHIYPLAGKDVCGLHVHNNLQIIDAHLNRRKSNGALDKSNVTVMRVLGRQAGQRLPKAYRPGVSGFAIAGENT